MKAQDIVTAILSNHYTVEELNNFISAVKHARTNQSMVNTFSMNVGMNVKFKHKGVEYKGSIKKVNRTTIQVITDSGNWKVPAHMLSPA